MTARRCLLGLCLAALALPAAAAPRVAIIIDDLGLHRGDLAVTELPAAVSCAVLPGRPFSARVARAAHAAGKEVLLHQPMQPVGAWRTVPGSVTLDMTESAVRATLAENLAAVPHAAGVNNHQGSLVTRHPGHMAWLMDTLRSHGGLYYIDSRTTAATVAERLAREVGVAVAHRNVFLDNRRERGAIRARLAELAALARRQGEAVAIGHPYPETLAVLRRALPEMQAEGIQVVPAGDLVETQRPPEGADSWQLSLSRSPRAAKSSRQ